MYAIEMLHIRKTFAGIVANDDITLKIKKNHIHALLGENGAGKSTLMSILFGLYQPDQGDIIVNGNRVAITNPHIASDLGIGMVHQHFKLIEPFTVTENIILGSEESSQGMIDIKKAAQKIQQLSDQYGLAVDPYAKIKDITVGMQQRVEILKMLYRQAEILIFDEPTAVLTPQEIDELMHIILQLQAEGKTILIITHKLREIKAIASECTIIRLGRYVDTVSVAQTSETELAELMVGRSVQLKQAAPPQQLGDIVLQLRHVSTTHNGVNLQDVNFAIRAGQIYGIAGVDGNGQDALAKAITGLVSAEGEMSFLGENIITSSIRQRTNKGMAYIPEDRHKYGLVLDFYMYENMAIQEYHTPKLSRKTVLNKKAMIAHSDDLLTQFDVRSGKGSMTLARALSGGNQQKAIIARELSRVPKLIIAVQPTRGLDVGAIEFIHQQLLEARDRGAAILLISFELDEILRLSDTIGVMYEGNIIAEVATNETNTAALGLLMAGVTSEKRGAIA